MSLALLHNEALARYTSWRIGGPATQLATVTTVDELRDGLAWAREHDLEIAVLGGGTNTLALDSGFAGLVLRWRAADIRLTIEADGDQGRVVLPAGAPMAGTVRRLAAQGWGGLEWAEGLPGTVGGAVFGNAGCYGGDVAGTLIRAWLLQHGQLEEWPVDHFDYSYRTSRLKQWGGPVAERPIVTAAEFRLHRADPHQLAARMAETAAMRKQKTPWGSSCGSVFKNPPGESAGRLIEASGLKGTRIGGAEIAEQHANYIVNRWNASSNDILKLIDLARTTVLHRFGVALELEVQILGRLE